MVVRVDSPTNIKLAMQTNPKINRGFSLVELAIALSIIGLILGMVVFSGSKTIDSGNTVKTLAILDDLSESSVQFKEQYKSLPGDMIVSNALPAIPNLPADCMSGGANAGDGNAAISALESACVPEHLFHAGLIKTDGTVGGKLVLISPYGTLRVISRLNSVGPNLLQRNISVVIELAGLPCEVAKEVDRKMDNDNISNGNIVASTAAGVAIPNCVPTDIIPFVLIPL